MVRAGAPTPSKRKEKESAALSAEHKAEEDESKRIRDAAFARRLLSRTRSHVRDPARPSKTILNSDGRDIVKKGHRKSKYLFAFPGLMAPVAAGKLGELTNLDSKNPILYVEFPQGRLKLFGTIIYPKNKYLTLHFPRGAGSVVCEDCFESLVVFSTAWWVGSREQNPEEARLPLPRFLDEDKHANVDFTAGAGQAKNTEHGPSDQVENCETMVLSTPKAKPEVSESESMGKDAGTPTQSQPIRQSARTAGKTLKYTEYPSDEEHDSDGSDSDQSQQTVKPRVRQQVQAWKEIVNKAEDIVQSSGNKATILLDTLGETPEHKVVKGNVPIDLEIASPTDSKTSIGTVKTPLKASSSKISLLKQSRLDAFCHRDSHAQEEHAAESKDGHSLESKQKGMAGALGSATPNAKRPRKVFKEDREVLPSADADDLEMGTPRKQRKRVKSEGGDTLGKETSVITVSTSRLKTSKSPKEGKARQTKPRKEKMGEVSKGESASKGRKPVVSRSSGVKRPKKGSEDEDELSDALDVIDDDSDEDWVG